MSRIKDPSLQHSAIAALHSPAATPPDSDSISIRSRHALRAFGEQNDEEDPWSALPRPLSSTSPPSAELLTPAQRNQLLLRALLHLALLFVACLILLGGTLYLALPTISPEDKPSFKIPKSFDDLKSLNSVLQHYKSSHFTQVLLCWVVVYMFLQAFSIPGSMYMSILAGALFGVPIALPLVCASVATGASIAYLISKFLGVVLVALPSWQRRVDDWKEKLKAYEGGNLLSYLIVIRMMPLPPHNIVNILSPHLGIPLPLFWLSTFCGIFAVSVIHTTIGEKLDQMTSPDDFHLFSLRNVLLLGGVCIAVLIPVFIKKFNPVEPLEQQESGRGAVHLEDGEEDAQQLPRSFRPPVEEEEDDEDELPRRNLNTSNIAHEGEEGESFPTWRADSEEEEEGDDEYLGRGGVFNDRLPTSNGVQTKQQGGLKGWISKKTPIKL